MADYSNIMENLPTLAIPKTLEPYLGRSVSPNKETVKASSSNSEIGAHNDSEADPPSIKKPGAVSTLLDSALTALAPRSQSICPPGLEGLKQVSQLFVQHRIELYEAISGIETLNRYEVKNSLNETVYWAYTDSACCTQSCGCAISRQFDIRILDLMENEVICLSRPLRCKCCFLPWCLQNLKVEAPRGTPVGFVKQAWHLCLPKYMINNADNAKQFCIIGPCCTCKMCGDVEFQITLPDQKSHIGHIIRHRTGLLQEIFTDTDSFQVDFPAFLDVKIKAVVLGAVFLIDFMHFERSDQKVTSAHAMPSSSTKQANTKQNTIV